MDGFVIDLVRDDLLIEIQTRGFSSMKRKLPALLDAGRRLRIVHPIAVDRWIVRLEADGTILGRRCSPKHGDVVDVFNELVSFPSLLVNPLLEVEVVLTKEDEYRVHTPGRSWRRKGWSVLERRLVDVVDTVPLKGPNDLLSLLPTDLPDAFTTADLATSLQRPRRVAQQMAYCLKHAGVIDAIGRQGNTIMYRVGATGEGGTTR